VWTTPLIVVIHFISAVTPWCRWKHRLLSSPIRTNRLSRHLLSIITCALVSLGMHLTKLITLSSIWVAGCSAQYYIAATSSTFPQSCFFIEAGSERQCWCTKDVKTAEIQNSGGSGGLVRLFSTDDCTVSNAEWVNSVSLGPSGSSIGPGSCPSSFRACDS
jgi:hypothetical protein